MSAGHLCKWTQNQPTVMVVMVVVVVVVVVVTQIIVCGYE